jgi:peroxiredoxin Q/BCP
MKLKPHDPIPLFTVQDAYGRTVDLAELASNGRYIVLWFYPRASSRGCTAQAKRYAELYSEFKQRGAEVFGVSADPAAAQCRFVEQMALCGGMIPDPTRTLGCAFGVGGWMGFGQLLGMYSRDTILINPQGRIEKIWRRVNPFRDAQVALEYLKSKVGASSSQHGPNSA